MLDGLIGFKNERLRERAKDIGIAAAGGLSIAQRVGMKTRVDSLSSRLLWMTKGTAGTKKRR